MNELKLIEEFKRRSGRCGKGVKVGIGDDSAVLDYDKDNYLLWAADMLVEGTHFNLKSASLEEIGRKAVAVNISDIAAMGGSPKYITVSIGVPKRLNPSSIHKIYDGIFKLCKEHKVKLIGGDTNLSSKLVIDVSILGTVNKKHLFTRSGAKEKDLILITGPVRDGKKEHLSFAPRLKEAQSLTRSCKVNSMIDTSDGIALDLGRIASSSGVGCTLYADAIPLSKDLSLKDALYFGESFELLFTMSVKEARRLFLKEKNGHKFFIIGEVTKKTKGLRLIGKEGKLSVLKKEGFRHL